MFKHVLSILKINTNEEFNKTLDVINTVRKYYSDLLARRKPATKVTPAEPIPPIK